MSRDDIFIIWGNGVNHIEEIIDIIREEYKIFFINKHEIVNMESFIKDIYKCDTVPWKHLIAKSRYLLNSPKYCYSVYVENNNPKEKYYGDGKFRHIQCSRIKETKEKIRNLYNPKHINCNRTEEHVIHGTDYEEQTIYLKKFLNIPNKKERESKNIKGEKIKVNANMLYCNILGNGIIPIKDSPHFKYIKGNKQEYRNYILKYLGVHLIHDHLPGSFDNLIKNFDIEKSDGITISNISNRFVVNDGLHRVCILINNGINEVEVYKQC